MKKILFGITSLTLGGAERVLVDLSNRLSKDYDITIFTIYDNGILKNQLNDNVKVISLYNKEFKQFNKLQRLIISFKILFCDRPPEGYDTYVAFLEGPITRLFSKEINKKKNNKNLGVAQTSQTIAINNNSDERLVDEVKIAWVHNDISKVFGNGFASKIKMYFDKKVYQKFNKIVFVSKENQDDFNKVYGNRFDETIIRNYLDYNKVIEKSEEQIELPYDKNDINLLTVCRLEEQKAIDRFVKIHARLEKEGIHCKVYVVGNGSQRYNIQRLIDKLKETECFYLLGAKENPYPYIKKCDYFCLLSYYEGYGMVLDEAKILNKPIIITDTAAKESIENYDKAIVLKNTEEGIFDGLKQILGYDLENESITKKQEKKYIEKVKKYYDKIIKEIEGTIG